MKSVSVSLPDGWDRELWKFERLFSRSFRIEDRGCYKELDLDVECTDPRLSALGKYGFPERGFHVCIRVPRAYIEDTSIESKHAIVVASVRTTDVDRPLPIGFSTKFSDGFLAALPKQATYRVFNALRALDRDIGDMWVGSILESKRVLKLTQGGEGEPVGSIAVSGASRCLFLHAKVDLLCLKCERTTVNVRLDLSEGSIRTDLRCSTCDRILSLSGTVDRIFGVDCAISRIDTASAYVFCNCGSDCSFVGPLRPHKQAEVMFICDCKSTDFSFELNSSVTLASQRKSPKHRPNPSSPKIFKEGVALPHNGACKHYKKSFRWLEYPCCNDWYPCKDCHDQRISSHECDSERVEAMMCGFCSKRQPIENVCIECGKETTPGWSAHERVRNQARGRKFKRNKK